MLAVSFETRVCETAAFTQVGAALISLGLQNVFLDLRVGVASCGTKQTIIERGRQPYSEVLEPNNLLTLSKAMRTCVTFL